jgi:prevent-host-death family protein
VSELRREISRLIFRLERSHVPVFVTQRGYVSAVLLSREDYDTLCVLQDKGLKAIGALTSPERLPRVREIEDSPAYWSEW